MKVEKYQLKSEETLTEFEFVSEGPNGSILKRIEFQETNDPLLFNLAFGDINTETGTINDKIVTNNSDTDKVLATVVAAVYAFCDRHREVFIYARGSSVSRTRLYRMGLSKFYKEMVEDFHLYGQIGYSFYPFQLNVNYEGFLAQRKFE